MADPIPTGIRLGAPAAYSGLSAFEGQPPVHLLFRFDLEDPAIPMSLPGTRWLPLLCAIRYGACDLGYRVISDDEVEILHQHEPQAWKGFPYKDYPERLPVESIALQETPYDPTKPIDVLYYAGVFGLEHLTPSQFEAAARYVVDEKLFDPSFMDYETPEEYVREGNCWPFAQGMPVDDCPDRTCPNHGKPGSLRMLAIFEEDEDRVRPLWGPSCGSLQILYQTCPACRSIRTINQCT